MGDKTASLLNNDTQGLLTSLMIHGLLIAFMWLYSVDGNLVEQPPLEEGMSIALGFEEESSLGEEAKGEQKEELITPEEITPTPTTPPKPQPKSEILTSKESPAATKSSPPKTEIKTPVKTTSTTNTVPTKTSDNSTQESAKKNDAEVSEKKKKFGSLFGAGQGDKEGNGTQGNPDGNPDSKVLEGISKGRGTIGGGLSGRKVVNAPTISETSQKQGRVVVKVCVDKSGHVISAKFTQGGSTTSDSQLVTLAERGAMKYTFAPGELDSQCGTITFDFKVT